MARYIMDCFYPDSAEPDGYRSQSFPIMANSQASAIEEANWTAIWRKPTRFALRVVKTNNETIVFKSEQVNLASGKYYPKRESPDPNASHYSARSAEKSRRRLTGRS